jgi:hypothetical protein
MTSELQDVGAAFILSFMKGCIPPAGLLDLVPVSLDHAEIT